MALPWLYQTVFWFTTLDQTEMFFFCFCFFLIRPENSISFQGYTVGIGFFPKSFIHIIQLVLLDSKKAHEKTLVNVHWLFSSD